MGGGSGGGGGMLRTVHRAVRAGFGGAPPEPFSHFSETGGVGTAKSRNNTRSYRKESTSRNTNLTLSSNNTSNFRNSSNGSGAFSSLICLPVSAASGAAAPTSRGCSSPTCSDDSEWECVDGSEGEMASGLYDDFVFGSVPSRDEAQRAVSAIQQALEQSSICFPEQKLAEDAGNDVKDEVTCSMEIEKGDSSGNTEIDWVEPSAHICNARMPLAPYGSDRVYDAFHLLQTEPSVQKMVISLSSDKSVWDAVLNNDVVKELRSSISQVEDKQGKTPDERSNNDSNPMDILSWVFVNAQAKFIQLIDKITKLVSGILLPPNEEEQGGITSPLEEKLKTSLFLSIIVLLIVVVARVQSV